jgi:type I restriction enzyme, S subunit
VSSVEVPLKQLALLNPETLGEDTEPARSFRYIDIATTGRGVLVDEPQPMTFEGSPSRARRVLRSGDTILSTVRTYLRAGWTLRGADNDLVASTGFVCLRPRAGVDGRFLGWLAQADTVVEEVVARSVGVSYPAVNPSDVGRIKVPSPPQAEQRAIADYLDHETARVDALVAARQRMVKLLEERRRSAIERLLWTDGGRMRQATTLRRLASRIDVGIAEAATHAYATHGVPLLRSMNIRENSIDDDDVLFIAPWFAERNRSKYVFANDILTVRTGNVGVSALVPQRLDRSQCFTQLISTIRQPHVAEFVCLALNSRRAGDYFQLLGWGSAQSNISVPILANAPVPQADNATQIRSVESVRAVNQHSADMTAVLVRQTALLEERRHALITAAVTGQLDIPEAS